MAIAGEVANLIVALKLDDSGFSGKLNGVGRALGRMDAGLSRMGRGVGQVGAGVARLGTIGAAAAAGGLAAVVTTAVSFEDAFAGVEKTVDASEKELDQLRDTFRAMAREIPVSFESLSALGETAGALGIAVDDIDEFVKVAATLGVTTDVAAEQAATSLGVLSNVLGLTGKDYERFADVLVRLGNEGASTESSILGIAERAGAGATLVGIAADETLAWSAAVANLGIEVEAGGSALQKFFIESLRNLQDDDTLEVMADTAGVTAKAFKKAFEKDASGALRQFVRGLGELENAERLAVLEALGFSDIRITRALLGLAGNVESTEDAFLQLGLAEGAATKEAEKRFATTASQIQLLKNNLRDAAAVIGSELLPVTNELIKQFVGFLNEPGTQKGLQQFAKDLAAGMRGLVTELKGTDFSGIIGGMKIAAQVAKGAFDAFRALPEPIQQLAIAALVANKVSGGAVGLIAKGLGNILLGGGGALGGLLGRGSSPVNPMFVSVVGGLPGAGAPVAGAGGGVLATAAKFVLGPAAAVIIGAEIGKAINEPIIAPAREFEEREVKAVLESGDAARIEAAIRAIEDQQNTDDILEQTALIASNIPFIGGALGEVGPKLDEQKRALEDQLREMGLTRTQAAAALDRATAEQERVREGVINEFRIGRMEQSRQQATIADRLKRQRVDMSSGFLKTTAALLWSSRVAAQQVVDQQKIVADRIARQRVDMSHGFLKTTAALLWQSRINAQQLTEQQRIAARVAEQRGALDRGFSASNGYLGTISRKDFSPTVNVSATINVSTSALTQTIRRQQIAIGRGPLEFAG